MMLIFQKEATGDRFAPNHPTAVVEPMLAISLVHNCPFLSVNCVSLGHNRYQCQHAV